MLKLNLLRIILFISLGIAVIPAAYNIFYIYPSFNRLSMEDAEDEAIRTAKYLLTYLDLKEEQFHSSAAFTVHFLNRIEKVQKELGIFKIKIFSSTGKVLYSTKLREIGTVNNNSYFKNIIARGRLKTKIVQKDTRSMEGEKVSMDIVETYIPVMINDRFIGAFELYYNISKKKEKIDNLLNHSLLTLFIMSLALALGMCWTLWKLGVQFKERQKIEKKLTLRNDQMQEDLNLAADFQQAILPEVRDFPFLKIGSKCTAYEEVSGDVFDISFDQDGSLKFFLGDATGHGVIAAFMTMMLQIALDNIKHELPTNEAMRQLNIQLSTRETGKFISGIYLRIKSNGLLTATHAGHPPLIIVPADGSDAVLFKEGGTVLGLFSEEIVPYKEEEYQLKLNDKIFLYTDGVIEWKNRKGTEFSFKRLLKSITHHRESDIHTAIHSLYDELLQFSEGEPCGDDLTIFGFQYLGGHTVTSSFPT